MHMARKISEMAHDWVVQRGLQDDSGIRVMQVVVVVVVVVMAAVFDVVVVIAAVVVVVVVFVCVVVVVSLHDSLTVFMRFVRTPLSPLSASKLSTCRTCLLLVASVAKLDQSMALVTPTAMMVLPAAFNASALVFAPVMESGWPSVMRMTTDGVFRNPRKPVLNWFLSFCQF